MLIFLISVLSIVLAGPAPYGYVLQSIEGMEPNACESANDVLSQQYTVTLTKDNIDNNYNFYPFQYGAAGTFANVNFLVGVTNPPVFIGLTDCFCSGDNFILANFGDLTFTSSINTSCDYTANCNTWSTDLQTCYDSSAFCKQSYQLTAGFYNFTVFIINSPYGFGTGYFVLKPGSL